MMQQELSNVPLTQAALALDEFVEQSYERVQQMLTAGVPWREILTRLATAGENLAGDKRQKDGEPDASNRLVDPILLRTDCRCLIRAFPRLLLAPDDRLLDAVLNAECLHRECIARTFIVRTARLLARSIFLVT